MKFRLDFVNHYRFTKEEKEGFEKIFNIRFRKVNQENFIVKTDYDIYRIIDEDMDKTIEIKSLDELIELGKKVSKVLDKEDVFIVSYDKDKDEWILVVYNDYIE